MDILAILERLKRITPGEWYSERGAEFDMVRGRIPDRPQGNPGVFQANSGEDLTYVGLVQAWWLPKDDPARMTVAQNNADFVAHAPQDIRDLLKERQDLIEWIWSMRAAWNAKLIQIANLHGHRADDMYKIMTEEDRDLNRRFLDFMFPLMNPHLKEEK